MNSSPDSVEQQFLAIVRANLGGALTTVDAAARLGVTRSELHRAAWREFGTSPTTLIQHHRLHAVHDALLSGEGPTTSIAGEASRYGFVHLGRFTAAYEHRFGVSPAFTLAVDRTPGNESRID